MIRPLATELALFLAPFAVYAVFLWATKARVLDTSQWSLTRLSWLVMTSLALMIGSFVFLAHFSGSPLGSRYTPAHVENGVLVPGQNK